MGGIVKSEGSHIYSTNVNSAVECGAKCNDANGCESVVYFDHPLTEGTNCYLFDKTLNGSEPLNEKADKRFASYFKVCAIGMI